MNLTYAQVIELFTDNGIKMARVRVGAAIQKVPLELLTQIKCGDTVLVCDGVAIARREDGTDVSRHSGKTH